MEDSQVMFVTNDPRRILILLPEIPWTVGFLDTHTSGIILWIPLLDQISRKGMTILYRHPFLSSNHISPH